MLNTRSTSSHLLMRYYKQCIAKWLTATVQLSPKTISNVSSNFYLRIFAYALLTSAILVLEKLKPNSIVLNVKGTDGKEDLEFKSMLTKKVKCIQERDIDLIEGMGYRKLTESSKSIGIDQVDLIWPPKFLLTHESYNTGAYNNYDATNTTEAVRWMSRCVPRSCSLSPSRWLIIVLSRSMYPNHRVDQSLPCDKRNGNSWAPTWIFTVFYYWNQKIRKCFMHW